MKAEDLKKQIIPIKITGAEYLILTEILDRVFFDMKYDTTDKVYRDKGGFILQMDSKEMAALQSLRKTLGIAP